MVSHMKTTVDLPDDLLLAAKKRAAETRTTVRAIFGARPPPRAPGASAGGPGRARRRAIRWVTAKGGLPPGLNVANRTEMHECLSREL